MKITITIPQTPLRNKTDREHWSKRAKRVKSVAKEVWVWMQQNRQKTLAVQVDILVVRYQRKGTVLADHDGVLGGAKQAIDAITEKHKHGVGLIRDDSPLWVRSIKGLSAHGTPRTEVTLECIEEALKLSSGNVQNATRSFRMKICFTVKTRSTKRNDWSAARSAKQLSQCFGPAIGLDAKNYRVVDGMMGKNTG